MTEISQTVDSGVLQKPKDRPIERISVDDIPIIYTNNVEVKVSVIDFNLQLGYVQEATEEKLVVRPLANVAMSPQHAKILAGILSQFISEYERLFGLIPSPPAS